MNNITTPAIEKYFSINDLKSVSRKQQYTEEFFEVFIEQLDFYILDAEDSLTDFDDESELKEELQEVLTFICGKIKVYIEKRKHGYSIAWCKKHIEEYLHSEEGELFIECFGASKEVSIENARDDVKLFCKLTNKNQVYTEYLIRNLFDNHGYREPSLLENAEKYSVVFQKQIGMGKTEVYADCYARLKPYYTAEYCELYANIFEEELIKGKNEDVASDVARNKADDKYN